MAELSVTKPSNTGRAPSEPERSLSDITAELWTNTEILVRQEIELAGAQLGARAEALKAELKLTAVAGAMLYVGVLALSAALILLLCEWLEPWIAALLVGAVLGGVGFLLARREPERITAAVTQGAAEPRPEPNTHSIGQVRR